MMMAEPIHFDYPETTMDSSPGRCGWPIAAGGEHLKRRAEGTPQQTPSSFSPSFMSSFLRESPPSPAAASHLFTDAPTYSQRRRNLKGHKKTRTVVYGSPKLQDSFGTGAVAIPPKPPYYPANAEDPPQQAPPTLHEEETYEDQSHPPALPDLRTPESDHGPSLQVSINDTQSYDQSAIRTQEGEEEIRSSAVERLRDTSPLGLALKKTPSLVNFIAKNIDKLKVATGDKPKGSKGKGGGETDSDDDEGPPIKEVPVFKLNKVQAGRDKMKASNFPASSLTIGTWKCIPTHEGDLVAKCYFAKRKLVWEMIGDDNLKTKIEIPWSNICSLHASYLPEDLPGTLELEVASPPTFYKESAPQPRQHTLWRPTEDPTGGQADVCLCHFLTFPPGVLSKHYGKLLQCDPRLNSLQDTVGNPTSEAAKSPKAGQGPKPRKYSKSPSLKCSPLSKGAPPAAEPETNHNESALIDTCESLGLSAWPQAVGDGYPDIEGVQISVEVTGIEELEGEGLDQLLDMQEGDTEFGGTPYPPGVVMGGNVGIVDDQNADVWQDVQLLDDKDMEKLKEEMGPDHRHQEVEMQLEGPEEVIVDVPVARSTQGPPSRPPPPVPTKPPTPPIQMTSNAAHRKLHSLKSRRGVATPSSHQSSAWQLRRRVHIGSPGATVQFEDSDSDSDVEVETKGDASDDEQGDLAVDVSNVLAGSLGNELGMSLGLMGASLPDGSSAPLPDLFSNYVGALALNDKAEDALASGSGPSSAFLSSFDNPHGTSQPNSYSEVAGWLLNDEEPDQLSTTPSFRAGFGA